MTLREFAKAILEGGGLEDKLLDVVPVIEESKKNNFITWDYQLPKFPSRSKRLKFSDEQVSFPKSSSFHLPSKRAMAMHFFANHELLAIEMMAAFLLFYPDNEINEGLKRGVLSSLKDEQKHLSLYLKRMKKLDGIELGDYPLNGFFWRQMKELKKPEDFLSFMSLTIEAANLDFALFYKDLFDKWEDFESSKVMDIVLRDEIKHVGLGYFWLNKWCPNKDFWNYYKSLLPKNITPARAKGIGFNSSARIKAGLNEDFINKVKHYRDDFLVTDRKNWKLKELNDSLL
jgi:uncharacterized ferritin-like protein (DUF455 family)